MTKQDLYIIIALLDAIMNDVQNYRKELESTGARFIEVKDATCEVAAELKRTVCEYAELDEYNKYGLGKISKNKLKFIVRAVDRIKKATEKMLNKEPVDGEYPSFDQTVTLSAVMILSELQI